MYNHLQIHEQAWLAGIIDGEGHIGLHYDEKRHAIRLRVQINMTCEATVKRCKKLFSTGNIYAVSNAKTANKDFWEFKAESKSAIFCLNLIKDYIFTKRAQMLIALEFGEKCLCYDWIKLPQESKDLAFNLEAQIKLLNRRGR